MAKKKNTCKCDCPPMPPMPPMGAMPQGHCFVEDKIWEKVNRKFATNEAVCKLAADIRKTNNNINIKANEAATVAAGLVLRQVGTDIENLNGRIDALPLFHIELIESDEHGHPRVFEPDFGTLYLTRAENNGTPDNQWDEWIAIPNGESFDWEHIGAKNIDLSWLDDSFDNINKKICKLNDKLNKLSRDVAKAIVDKAVRPLEELREYLNSTEFITSVLGDIPLVTLTNNGLMSSGMLEMLNSLTTWATEYRDVPGGGALGEDYVNSLFD